MVKIDVEGHELNVLQGGYRVMSERVDFVILEMSLTRDVDPMRQRVVDLFVTMQDMGFKLINIFDAFWIDAEVGPANDVILVQFDGVFRSIRRTS